MTAGSARVIQHPMSKQHQTVINQKKLRRHAPISYRLTIGILGFIFCLLPFCLSFFQIADLDVCMVERFPNRADGPSVNPAVGAAIDAAINPSNQTSYQTNKSLDQSTSVKLQDVLVDSSDFLADMIADPLDTINQPINQSNTQSNKKFRPRSQSTSIMVILLITCCLIKACLPVPHVPLSRTNSQSSNQISHHQTINQTMPFIHAFKVLLAYLWYLAAYFLCNALKGYIGDETCNIHANSISGHYLFHFYAGLALFHIHAQQTQSLSQSICSMQFWRRLLRTNQAKFFMFFFLCYCLSSFIILMNTYLHGYHSMRQILYGIAMAMFAHWMMMDVLDMIDELIVAHIEKTIYGRSNNQSLNRTNIPLTRSQQLRQRQLAVDDTNQSINQSINQSNNQTINQTNSHRQFSNFSPFQKFLYWVFSRSLRVSEEKGLFFIFPFLFVLLFQLIGFIALLMSPASSMWKTVDLIVLALSWALLVFIYVKYLKLPMGSNSPRSIDQSRSPSRQQHKQVVAMSLHADNQA